jgi:hypothetical protein
MDRLVEADADALLRQLRRGRARPPLADESLSRLATSEVCLNEVARHTLDATARALRWKRQNV